MGRKGGDIGVDYCGVLCGGGGELTVEDVL